jgi:hypothetical protein
MSTNKIVMIYLVVGLSIGGGGSYFIMNNQIQTMEDYYENQIEQVQDALQLTTNQKNIEISNLGNVVDEIQDSINTLQALNDEYSNHIDELENEIDSKNIEINSLESDVSDLEKEVSSLEDQNWDKNTEIQYLENEIDNILNLEVTQHYEWEYGWDDWSWDLPIPLELYWEYHERSRPDEWTDWVSMCKDSGDDYYIKSLVDGIESATSKKGYSKYETVEYVISFVQSLPYTVDDETTPWDEYPRYPIETLFDRGGDCEDTSILTATLLYEMGYDVALLILVDENHCAVGIKGGEGIYGTYYTVGSTKYFYVETTGDGWGIGDFPDFDSSSARIYPLNDY